MEKGCKKKMKTKIKKLELLQIGRGPRIGKSRAGVEDKRVGRQKEERIAMYYVHTPTPHHDCNQYAVQTCANKQVA